MKQSFKIFIECVSLLILSFCCKKNSTVKEDDDTLFKTAKQFFLNESNKQMEPVQNMSLNSANNDLRKTTPKNPDWEKAYIIQLSTGKGVVVPVIYQSNFIVHGNTSANNYYAINDISKLLIYKDQFQNYHSELITFFPDSNFESNKKSNFTGIISLEQWSGNLLKELKFSAGKIKQSQGLTSNPSSGIQSAILSVQVCYSYDEYNYSVDDPDGGIYSTTYLGCDDLFVDAGTGSGLASGNDYGNVGTGGGINPVSIVTLPSGDNIIGNIQDYNKCFTNIGGSDHIYQVTLCVSQPIPNSSDAWGFAPVSSSSNNPINVGHTFLIMTEASPSGTVTRNVGFYPSGTVSTTSPTSPGQLNNDALHSYNISLTITVDNGQFFNMLNFISRAGSATYNLNSDNCTTFALNTLTVGDIALSVPTGSWPGGSGFDPGDLGQFIRFMTLSPGMTRNFSSSSHPNLGVCVN